MKALEVIKFGSKLLKEKKIGTNILDSELLLSKILNKSREEILINLDQEISEKNFLDFRKYLIRRSHYEPVAYILGEKEFWSKKFHINKDTLIPRPETELLIDSLIKKYKRKKISILDIGTGSGCIIVSLLSSLENCKGEAYDLSKNAILMAKKNAIEHKISDKVKFFNRSFDKIFAKKFDLIVSNPPYIKSREIKNLTDDVKKYEPRMALDGGNDGLDLIKKVIYKSTGIIKIKGTLALEIGNEQIKKVSKILTDNNYSVKQVIKDNKNNIRSILATYK